MPAREPGAAATAADVRLLSADALAERLEPLPLSGDSVKAGSPRAGAMDLQDVAGVQVGIWELTPGTVTDVEADEVFVVLAGRGLLTHADGSRSELAPGTVMRLFRGDRTVWEITETLRKIYVS